MHFAIPAWTVNWTVKGESVTMRVPDDNLEAFVAVLRFNSIDYFTCDREKIGHGVS